MTVSGLDRQRCACSAADLAGSKCPALRHHLLLVASGRTHEDSEADACLEEGHDRGCPNACRYVGSVDMVDVVLLGTYVVAAGVLIAATRGRLGLPPREA